MNKKHVAFVVLILSVLAFAFHLFQDEALHPKVSAAIEYYGTEPDYEQNIMVGLLGLQNDEVLNPMPEGRRIYTALLANKDEGQDAHLFPSIKDLPSFDEYEFFCYLDEPSCIGSIAQSQRDISKILAEFAVVLTHYYSLYSLNHHSQSNAGFINSHLARFDLGQAASLDKLVFLDIYNLILKGDLAQASEKFSQHLSINRKLLKASSDMVKVQQIANGPARYHSVISALKQAGYQDWQSLKDLLTPLSEQELSLADLYIKFFADSASLFKTKRFINMGEENPLTNMKVKLFYKENMTLNMMYQQASLSLLPLNYDKGDVFSLLDDKRAIVDKNDEQLKQDSENIWLYGLKNYNNWVGAIMHLTASPRFVDIQLEVFALDVNYQLLQLVMIDNIDELQQQMAQPAFINPYTGKQPIIEDEQICYEWPDNSICMAWQ